MCGHIPHWWEIMHVVKGEVDQFKVITKQKTSLLYGKNYHYFIYQYFCSIEYNLSWFFSIRTKTIGVKTYLRK